MTKYLRPNVWAQNIKDKKEHVREVDCNDINTFVEF